jgi:hypothetical protein
MKKVIIIFSFLFAIAEVYGQSLDLVSVFLRGGINDANKLTDAYVSPLGTALSKANNSSWNFSYINDKKPHLWVDLKYNYTFVPSSDREYDINKLNLEEIIPSDPNYHIAQTVFGDKTSIQLETKDHIVNPLPPFDSKPLATFNSTEGLGMRGLNLPYLNIGTSYKGLILILRGLPPLPISDSEGSIGLWGVGAGVSFNDVLKPLNDFPVIFRLTAAYSSTIINVKQDLQPDEAFLSISDGPYNNQNFKLKTGDFTIGLFAMKSFNIITASAGFGYNYIHSTSELTGTYPIYVKDPAGLLGFSVADIEDPISISNSDNYFNAQFNIAAKFNFFLLNLNYSTGKYGNLTAGIGFIL